MLQERVVGYDFRLPIPSQEWPPSMWSPGRRALYLLDRTVAAPLSADAAVWPEAIPEDQLPDLEEGQRWHRSFLELQQVAGAVSGQFIALTEICAEHHDRTAMPPHAEDSCRLLGYDVVDEAGMSCLMNYGFSEPERKVAHLRRAFGSHLNRHHLFSDALQAQTYARLMDTDREPGHGPYCVIGVWLV